MIDFTPKQLKYIDSSLERNVHLKACPGSGKTEVTAAKVAKEIDAWMQFPAGMAILSFSNSATDELRERISIARRGNQREFPHFIGTIDSFVLKNIVTPLSHKITGYPGDEGDFTLRIISHDARIFIKTKYGYANRGNVAANSFDWDLATERFVFFDEAESVKKLLNAIILQPHQIQDLLDTKQRFYAKGFATYKDVERLALSILGDKRFEQRIGLLVARYPCVVVDECQDLSAEQITILTMLVKRGIKLHLVGDLNQSIYGFRNCNPVAIFRFIASIEHDEMLLDENFRSGQAIVDMHGKFVHAQPITGRPNFSPQTCYLLEYNQCPTEVLTRFDALALGHAKAVIVARGHSTLDKFRYATSEKSPVETLALAILVFSQGENGTLQRSLGLFSAYLAETCIRSHTGGADVYFRPVLVSSTLAWHQFLYSVLSAFVENGLANQTLTWKMWCVALKAALPRLSVIDPIDPTISQVLSDLQQKRHPSPKNLGESKLVISLRAMPVNKRTTRLATIHEVKGETHDLTMLVSSTKKGKQSHWKEWLEDATSEAARLAYVASSRPRHILIWAVKSLKKDEKQQLLKLGFQHISN
ncbi:UvrD-helicase domain-containing protein [Glaciimonas sp. GG7]